MYTLYFLPGACSLATQVLLRELGQDVTLIHKNTVPDFQQLNPSQQVPVLQHNGETLTEGAAIMLYLLKRHANSIWPTAPSSEQAALADLLFANATMHPAYGRLFFISRHLEVGEQQTRAYAAAAAAITLLWQQVEQRLQHQSYLAGEQFGAADLLLAVYSRWGQFFPVSIPLGPQTQRMLNNIIARSSFQQALLAEQQASEEE